MLRSTEPEARVSDEHLISRGLKEQNHLIKRREEPSITRTIALITDGFVLKATCGVTLTLKRLEISLRPINYVMIDFINKRDVFKAIFVIFALH